MKKIVEQVVAFSLKNSFFVFIFTGILLVAGIISYIHTPIEAFPDVTNTRARIITQWPGRSAEEVEKFITLPITKAVNTIPKKAVVRSVSLFGLSVVTVIFEDDVEDFYAQQYTATRLQGVDLPDGAGASIEPPSGATGEIFRYVIRSAKPISEITAIQDWLIERELVSVPGVADVISFGGEEKIYEITVNPIALKSYGLSPLQLYEAVKSSNINVGGDVIQKGAQAYVVRGVGLLESIEDIENILVKVNNNTPVLVKHVANVHLAAKPRMGQVGLDAEDDLVQGIVVMLRGENPGDVIERVKEKISDLNSNLLPEDVKIEPFLDRTTLVDATVKTVTKNLAEGIVLVSLIVFLFLFNWRTTVIVALVIPLSFLFAIIMLRFQGLPANLISMGALDFGLLLEGTLVIVEQIMIDLEKRARHLGMARYNRTSKMGPIRRSTAKVAAYVFFAQIILIIALVPIFSFQKVEGKMFAPLAFTLGYALIGSLILSLTFVPAMCKWLLNKNIKERESFLTIFFRKHFFNFFLWTNKRRKVVLVTYILVIICAVTKFMFYGSEFIPKLNEGAIYVRATLPNSINLEEAVKLTKEMKTKLRTYQEVSFILSQTGRPNDGTDPTGFFNIEFHIQLKEQSEWAKKRSKEALIADMKQQLAIFPGTNFAFSQPIQDNVEEYVAGVKSALVVKVAGDDLFELERIADNVASSIQVVKGVEDINVYRNIGLPELRIKLSDTKMARYGVRVADAQAIVEMAIGGKAASSFYENERQFDINIRFQKHYRETREQISNLLIPALGDQKVPLKEIATLEYITGPAFIYREAGSRYIAVGFSIEGRDLGTTIQEARAKVAKEVALPTGYKIEWAGEFESKERATKQLAVIVPIALLAILFLLYLNFGSLKDTLIAASSIPFAFIGGFLSLLVTQTIFGISAGIGFIILFGVNTINAILLITVMKENLKKGIQLHEAVSNAVYQRIRPIIMIALMGSLGLLPAALSTGVGSEIQKPLAIMIVGGLMVCMLLSFSVLPQLFYWAYRKAGTPKIKRSN